MTFARKLRIVFTAQNVGVDLIDSREGNAIKIRYIVQLLKEAGHSVRTISLIGGPEFLCTDDITQPHYASPGFTNWKPYRLIEGAVRRIQGAGNLPYFALFDTVRQYDVTVKYAQGFDLIHEHVGLFSLGSTLAARRLKLPYVLNWEGDLILERDYMEQPLRGWQRRWAQYTASQSLQSAAAIIVVSEPYKEQLCQRWPVPADKVFVLPNGVDTTLFAPIKQRRERRLELGLADEPTIVFVGSFWPWHGLDILVESFPRILAAVPKAQLLLVGDGQEREATEARVAALGLADRVTFTGRVQLEDVPRYIQAADVAVAPFPKDAPNSEMGSPMKLYEYMAAGTAVVATRIGQMPDVVQDGENGLLVEPSDPEGLAQAVIALLSDSEKRRELAREARKTIVNRHSWQHFVRALETVYAFALGNGS